MVRYLTELRASNGLTKRLLLDEEFSSLVLDDSLGNIKVAFSGFKKPENDSFWSNAQEELLYQIKHNLVERGFGYLTDVYFKGYDLLKDVLKFAKIDDAFMDEVFPDRELTPFKKQRIYEAYNKFQELIGDGHNVEYLHTSKKYDPSLTEDLLTRALQIGWDKIPVLGEISVDLPERGEVVHMIQFRKMDSQGFYHAGYLQFTYGGYKQVDLIGTGGELIRTAMGPVQVDYVEYKSIYPGNSREYDRVPLESIHE